ncbi:hypothetical protein KSP40_PGU020732 [Platanthera guangdongensis]|uniref:Uncharacterized protein n=1 Tax=Platanthera guangdongensis TaxID=2320717 RepID=A0ABR2LES8_9ASPA
MGAARGERSPFLFRALIVVSCMLLFGCRAMPVRILQGRWREGGTVDVSVGRRRGPRERSVPAAGFNASKRSVPSCPDPLHNRR